MILKRIFTLPQDFETLKAISVEEGFHFLQKMQDFWEDNNNRFNKVGEALFAYFDKNNHLIAICGLNIDPYTSDKGVGRIRHLYVTPEHRRKSLAKNLIHKVLSHGAQYFDMIRLRTDNPDAALFYESLGFDQTKAEFVTHSKHIKKDHFPKDFI